MSLSDDLRARAKAQRDMANQLIDTHDLIKQDGDGKFNAKNLVIAVAGIVNATVLSTHAEILDYQRGIASLDRCESRLGKIKAVNNAIRAASAQATLSGDWSKFDAVSSDIIKQLGNPDRE